MLNKNEIFLLKNVHRLFHRHLETAVFINQAVARYFDGNFVESLRLLRVADCYNNSLIAAAENKSLGLPNLRQPPGFHFDPALISNLERLAVMVMA